MCKKIFFVLVATLLFAGIGCEKSSKESLVNSVQNTPEQTENTIAQQRRVADSVANLLPTAMVLTDGTIPPAEGIERLEEKTFGCADRIGYVRLSRETATENVAYDALATLFSARDSNVQGLYNPLWESTLKVKEVQLTPDSIAIVKLEGQLLSAGECDDPRLKEQVEATVRQYWPKYQILLNGSEAEWRCIGNLSGQCK
jgi:hypothetical protein